MLRRGDEQPTEEKFRTQNPQSLVADCTCRCEGKGGASDEGCMPGPHSEVGNMENMELSELRPLNGLRVGHTELDTS